MCTVYRPRSPLPQRAYRVPMILQSRYNNNNIVNNTSNNGTTTAATAISTLLGDLAGLGATGTTTTTATGRIGSGATLLSALSGLGSSAGGRGSAATATINSNFNNTQQQPVGIHISILTPATLRQVITTLLILSIILSLIDTLPFIYIICSSFSLSHICMIEPSLETIILRRLRQESTFLLGVAAVIVAVVVTATIFLQVCNSVSQMQYHHHHL